VNEPEEIRESFQRFYQSTILEGETDPNSLYDRQREIFEFHLYTKEDVSRFCKVFYDRERDEGELHPILDHVVDKFRNIEDEEKREGFRAKIQSYTRMYGYLSQIMNFEDIELEKTFVFLKFLNKKLPKRDVERFDVSDTIDLDSLRIQVTHEHVGTPFPDPTTVTPPTFGTGGVKEPEHDLLSKIVADVNTKYGVNLTEDDRIDLSRLHQRLVENPEVEKYMNGSNSDANKKMYFKQIFEGMMVDFFNERFEFYKKMEDNPSMKNLIFNQLYRNYHEQRNGS
jgi:type I restriction enzyme R subunit